jgi:6-phosphogluconolactonase (cycloisomerase 2 family)
MSVSLHPRVTRLLLLTATLVVGSAVAAAVATARADARRGVVYTLSNSPSGNEVLIFDRAGDGTLTPAGAVPTGGLGTGVGLGSQNAVVLGNKGQGLYAVNAGDNTISAFKVTRRGLEQLGGPVSSGGVAPISLTVHGNLLYVLNAGDDGSAGNITGFKAGHGGLTPIAGSTRPLSSSAFVDPPQVQFSPDGRLLLVTEKATNLIDVYRVGADGLTVGPNSQASAAATPFGFAFDKQGDLIVSDAVGAAPGASGLSSYDVSETGVLTAVTPFLGDTQTAACWVVVTKNGRFTYTTNTGSNTISTYSIADDGSLTLLDAVGASTGSAPIDEALSSDSRYLYALVSGAIDAFSVGADGALAPISGAAGLPTGATGLAAT